MNERSRDTRPGAADLSRSAPVSSPSAAVNAAEYLLTAGRPEAVALVDGDRRHTYRELSEMVARVAGRLEQLDLPPGSAVGLLGGNSFFWVASYLAVMGSGHVAVPVADKLSPEDIRRNLDLVGCSVVLAARRLLRRVDGALDGLLVIDDSLRSGVGPERRRLAPVCPGDDAVYMFTSGSTARPKAVRVTHGNLQANTDSVVEYLGLRSDDRTLVVLPFFYCYGASLLHSTLRMGGTLVLCNSFAFVETAVDLLEHERCTVVAGVPSTYQMLLRASTFARRHLPDLRIIQQAGGKLVPVLVDELVAAHPGADVFVMYGQTEATARLSYLPPADLVRKRGSIGRGIPGVRLSVLGEDGTPVAPGQQGEIYAFGDNISPGYREDPDATASKFTVRGLRTGDLATIDDEGYIFIVDRKDDFIKPWGIRVSSQEIEAAVLRMPELVLAAAVGVPDDTSGEAVVVFAQARPGALVTPEQVVSFCSRHLARHMVPRSVQLIDALELNANGKVAKHRLRGRAQEPVS